MNRIKTIGLLVFMVFITAGPGNAEEKAKEVISDKLEMKQLWSKQYEKAGAFLNDDGRAIIILPYNEGNETVGERIQFIDEKGNIINSFVSKKEIKIEGPAYVKMTMYSGSSNNGEYFLFSSYLDESTDGIQKYLYYTGKGKKLWSKELWVDHIKLSPDGEYLGYSGALNEAEPSGMDVWEVIDKNNRLMYQYKPDTQFDAIVLNGGKTMMIEGSKLKLFDSGGRLLKEAIIPALEPYRLSYQFGYVNPSYSTGPKRLVSTKDGRYAAFVYSMEEEDEKDWLYTLFSVDMKTGKWWSYPLKTTAVEGGVHVTSDGKNLIVLMSEGLFFFDNVAGKLLWKDTTGWDLWESGLTSDLWDISEDLGLIAIKWSKGIGGKGRKEERFYILNFQGKRVWGAGSGSADGDFSRHSDKFLLRTFIKIDDNFFRKYSLYKITKR